MDRRPNRPTPHICGQCQKKPPAFTSVIAAFAYEDPIRQLIIGLKYQRQLYLARVLGSLLADTLAQEPNLSPDIIMPIPLHRSRLRSRGFNQAYEIARFVAKRLHIPLDPWILERNRNTPTQTDLPRRSRAKNVRDAFAVKGDVTDLRIALLDDVMTTGHTANAAALALLRAGAKEVQVWLVARA